MKKISLIFLCILFFTSCDVEPLDPAVLTDVNNNNGNGNTSREPLALSVYSFDVNLTVPIFGSSIANNDFSFNASNKVSTAIVESIFLGESIIENVTLTRDNANRIIGFQSMSSGVLTNETLVTYNGNNITKIVYNYVEDDEDDYTYNFTYTGNTITRTELSSTISTIFTLNGSDQLIRKESFDGINPIKTEVLDYDGLGNCIASLITGEDPSNATFTFDSNENPLKGAFNDQFLLSFLDDDYSDDVGIPMAQFSSPNNWIRITTLEETVNFSVQYDVDNRIISRTGNYDLGDGVVIQQAETFSFVN